MLVYSLSMWIFGHDVGGPNVVSLFLSFWRAVDLLGWTLRRCSHCSLLPSVHFESWSCQGSWVIQERSSCVICSAVFDAFFSWFWEKEKQEFGEEGEMMGRIIMGVLLFMCMRAWNCRYHLLRKWEAFLYPSLQHLNLFKPLHAYAYLFLICLFSLFACAWTKFYVLWLVLEGKGLYYVDFSNFQYCYDASNSI